MMPTRLALLAAIAAVAPTVPHRPPVGSAERKAVLDALRPSIEARFRSPVQFKVAQLCVLGDQAVVLADPQRPDGGPVPWRNAQSADEHALGGTQVSAVLRRRDGRWTLIESAIGATDVWYESLAPRALIAQC